MSTDITKTSATKNKLSKQGKWLLASLATCLVAMTIFTAFRAAPSNNTSFEGSISYKIDIEMSEEAKQNHGGFQHEMMDMVAKAGIIYSTDGGNKDLFAVETDSFNVKVLNDYTREKSFINFAAMNSMNFNFSLSHAELLGAMGEHDIKAEMEKEGATLDKTGTKRIAGVMCDEITINHKEIKEEGVSIKIYLAPSIKTTTLLTEVMAAVDLEGMPLGVSVQAKEGSFSIFADQVKPGKVNSEIFKVIESGIQIPLNMKDTFIPGLKTD